MAESANSANPPIIRQSAKNPPIRQFSVNPPIRQKFYFLLENSFSNSNQLNSPKFSIPLDLNNETDNVLNKNSNCGKKDKIIPKKSFTTNKKNCLNYFKFNQNILKINFLGKKKENFIK